jgi:hypothetical protein
MRKTVALALTAILASGCADQIKAPLDSMMGRNISIVVAKLGEPSARRSISGNTTYVWDARNSMVLIMVTDFGGAPVGSSTTLTPMSVPGGCRIEITVDSHNTMRSYRVEGNSFGCGQFNRALRQ